MKEISIHLLARFNSLYKELDDIYHLLARHYGLSDCAFWILYTIRESEERYTQSQLGEALSLRKQTINSALKTLEKAGYIRLTTVPGNQKSKEVLLTEEGARFTAGTIDKVVLMERETFERFTEEEQTIFFRLFTSYVRRLGTAVQGELDGPKGEV